MYMNLTRTLSFGAVHSIEEYGKKVRTMGYDYKLEVSLRGKVDPKTGIVFNIVLIDQALEEILKDIDGKCLDQEVPFFFDKKATIENLLIFLKGQISRAITEVDVHKVKIVQDPFLWGEIKEDRDMNIYVTQSFHFSAAHRLHSPALDQQENIDLFGKCNNYYGHGHNYYLEVTVNGEPDPETGTVIHYKELETIVNREVVQLFDHKHMNMDLPYFKDKNPTSELVLSVVWDLLESHLPKLYKVGIWETEKNYFEYYGPDHV